MSCLWRKVGPGGRNSRPRESAEGSSSDHDAVVLANAQAAQMQALQTLQNIQKRWRHILLQDAEQMSLVLANQDLNRECFKFLIQESAQLLGQEHVTLDGNNNDDKRTLTTTLATTTNKKLERLSFRYMCFRHNDNNLQEITDLLCQFLTVNQSTLKVMNLDSCTFNSTANNRALSRHMDRVIATLGAMQSLEYLALDSIALHRQDSLTNNFSTNRITLRSLNLTRIILSDSSEYEQIISSIRHLTQLEGLFLSQDSYMDDDMMELLMESLQSLTQIQDLYLRRQMRLSPTAMSSMASFLDRNQSLHLLDLLGNCNLFDIERLPSQTQRAGALQNMANFASAIQKHPQLHALILRHCGLDDTAANVFFREFNQTTTTTTTTNTSLPMLRHLDLTMNSFRSPMQWIPSLARGLGNLEELGIPPTFAENTSTIASSDDAISQAVHPSMSLVFVFDAWKSGGSNSQQRRAMASSSIRFNSAENPAVKTRTNTMSWVEAKRGNKLKSILERNQLISRVLFFSKSAQAQDASNDSLPVSLWPQFLQALDLDRKEVTPVYLFLCNMCSTVQIDSLTLT